MNYKNFYDTKYDGHLKIRKVRYAYKLSISIYDNINYILTIIIPDN